MMPPGFPTPIDIMGRLRLNLNNKISCFVHGILLIKISGDLSGGNRLLERLDMREYPEAIHRTVTESLNNVGDIDHLECVNRLKRLTFMHFAPAEKLYAEDILGRATGVEEITSALMELDRLFPPDNMLHIRSALKKRLWATTARKRGEAQRLRVRAQKARSEVNHLQRLNQSNPSDKNLKRAQTAEEKALELERKADRAAKEVEQNMARVVEADMSIKQARAIATLKAREDAIAARARAKALREEAKQAEREEAKRAREEATEARKASKPAKRAKE
jgi:hypothetical protein